MLRYVLVTACEVLSEAGGVSKYEFTMSGAAARKMHDNAMVGDFSEKLTA